MVKIPTKKLANGFEIPIYGLGTWTLGDTTRDRNPTADIQKAVDSVRICLEAGVTNIDTAQLYGDGQVEEIIGKAIKGYPRKSLFVTSKVRSTNLGYTQVLEACHQSLAKLETNYLDLYLIHARKPEFDLEETIKAMDELVDTGLVKNIGVSNFNNESLREAQSYSRHPIVVNQVHYNLIFREPEVTGLLDYCQKNNVILQAWRPIEFGNLGNTTDILINKMCNKYSKSPIQIAINWLISQPNIVTIAKTSNNIHLKENLESLNWKMDSTDIEELRANFPGQQSVSNAVPLS